LEGDGERKWKGDGRRERDDVDKGSGRECVVEGVVKEIRPHVETDMEISTGIKIQ